jgi:hypothetical protein
MASIQVTRDNLVNFLVEKTCENTFRYNVPLKKGLILEKHRTGKSFRRTLPIWKNVWKEKHSLLT